MGNGQSGQGRQGRQGRQGSNLSPSSPHHPISPSPHLPCPISIKIFSASELILPPKLTVKTTIYCKSTVVRGSQFGTLDFSG
ncbi:hypothetical protein VF14_22680 [Nostoc linckia z18]|uniref:Uncharacterized protein n=2 Tax=Nostoc linckia TaxID=92942 RepID=A0A9Q5Z9B8_NOSLI|nr:hypothetical protein [Nostoc linckia]PHK39938.1 hypothetical protein VF12_12425 [Nostoc linckia z15]PHK47614.1 hypothetical protein VF13_04030 [Nostoc linckia z16]PHJ56809.1 hypothetical protein VF02_31935 [Nostoc linckia z1]PHJ62700.1 hypothetical protein VF03_30990 [Nostoc linckia z2]PHJ67393.1 hypothetical protein VF05_17405 [Nostoc linckia z3]